MNLSVLFSLTLGVAKSVFLDRGDNKAVQYIDRILLAYQQGQNVDVHLQAVADHLNTGVPLDFDMQLQLLDDDIANWKASLAGGEE